MKKNIYLQNHTQKSIFQSIPLRITSFSILPRRLSFKAPDTLLYLSSPRSFLSLPGKAFDLLVTVSCVHYCTSTSVLSTSCSLRGLRISHLEGGFTLRCLQRLSLPDLATLPWCWSPTDTPEVRPPRSSRTKGSSSQISCARAG